MEKYEVRFLYKSAALLLHSPGLKHIVVGDLHIGLERKLAEKGVRLYGAAEMMAGQLRHLAESNGTKSIIILGDVKESILNPDEGEIAAIRQFFDVLAGLEVRIAVGNHDARLENFVKEPIAPEILLGNAAMLHGHMWPSEEAMSKDYIIIAHNHVAVAFRDENNAFYNQKAWLVAALDPDGARKRYKKFNSGAKLIVMPAFNDLITGRAVNEVGDNHINPLFRNRIFDYESATVYSMDGSVLGTPLSLKK